eukprot:TRINITY_DN14289_c0_g1_i1.p1 TRINITY_DN14289_c0_g1~~TRINITY_DN14289_c0_g1_i1.p1  ORF type:complete len:739 (+),score=115.81 TRINITY_DN14289_c0_g1_i1:42-2258(+)
MGEDEPIDLDDLMDAEAEDSLDEKDEGDHEEGHETEAPSTDDDDPCQDDQSWKDEDGDGCHAYASTLSDENVNKGHLCAGHHTPGHDRPDLHCRRLCGTCGVRWKQFRGHLIPVTASPDESSASQASSGSQLSDAAANQDDFFQVHSSWTPTSAFVAVSIGAKDGQLGTEHGKQDLELVDSPLRVLHITDSHVSTESENPLLFGRMHQVRESADFHTRQSRTHFEQLQSALRLAAEAKVDLVLLGGDLVNFPSPGSVRDVLNAVLELPVEAGRRIPFIYTAGNHDWMAEGAQPGCSFERFEGARLAEELYAGDEQYGSELAMRFCLDAGVWCGGVTCEVPGSSCTLRKSRETEPASSEQGSSESYVKRCEDAPYDAQREPNRLGPLQPFYGVSGFLGSSLPPGFDVSSIDVEPGFSATELRGVNFVALDNSNYAFDQEQRAFLQTQLSRNLPIVLLLHIPLHVPGGPGRDLTGTPRVGDPEWGDSIDAWAKMERRPRWPKENTPDTMATVELIRTRCVPHGPIVAILTGHEHMTRANPVGSWHDPQSIPQIFGTHRWGHYSGTMQFTTQDGGHGASRILEVAVHKPRPRHCHEVRAGGWTYRVCLGEEISQFRGEVEKNPYYSLGKHIPDQDQVLPDGASVSAYAGGTDGRRSTVIVRCSHDEATLVATEPEIMQYVIEAWLPSACDPSDSKAHSTVLVSAVAGLLALLLLLVCAARRGVFQRARHAVLARTSRPHAA